MSSKNSQMIGKIHSGDCIKGLKKVSDKTVDLVFADPPFNIGFKYDAYDDRLENNQYLTWSHDWISEVYRVLKPDGTFWLAIGDEYAAELKIEALKVGFHCRSWVIWYYTFGVNCTKKFTRSHAHLFHFVKDEKSYTFNYDDTDLRVPSARRLVYNDARANPHGRMPDDTWILRPQELVNGFDPDEDTWYFPRVAGTFKERAGFHGCQMPEQLLGRIIRSCSNQGDLVVDPFSGSATTLAVAKKMNRTFFGFELSTEYARLGRKRLKSISIGDKLDGADEPTMSNIEQIEKQKIALKKTPLNNPFPNEQKIHLTLSSELPGIIEAFASSNQGFSIDRVVVDPILNEDFQLACDRLSIPGTSAERNRHLFRMRKAGKLKSFNINTKVRTKIDWEQVGPFIYASEIAWSKMSNLTNLSLDNIFCDPRYATQFDDIASKFAPGFQPLEYRWAALKLRKEGSLAKHRATQKTPKQFGIAGLNQNGLANEIPIYVSELKENKLKSGPAVYLIRELDGKALYAGETCELTNCFERMFGNKNTRKQWLGVGKDLKVFTRSLQSVTDYRFARQSHLLKWHKPKWNTVENFSL